MKPNLVVQLSRPIGISLLVGLIVGASLSRAHADQGGLPAQVAALQADVQTLQQQVRRLIEQAKAQNATITQLTAVVDSQSALISQLQRQNQALECMYKIGNDVYFSGCNVHIVSGSGATEGPVNGLGNLIIGYNEDATAVLSYAPPSIRGGSHNLVVGPGHSYTSYGGLVAGRVNSVTGPNATVSGGVTNTASGFWSSISGGESNNASGTRSSVGGGVFNVASGHDSSVSGGSRNTASMFASSISGGIDNTASAPYSSVSGGWFNVAQ